MWSIEKVKPRIEVRGKRPRLVRYEYKWMISCYGAFWGVAATRKRAEKALREGQRDMFEDGYP